MTRFQRIVLGATAGVVAARLIFPVTYTTRFGDRPDLTVTLFQVLAIIAICAALFVLKPSLPFRVIVFLSALAALILAAWFAYPGWQSFYNSKIEASRHRIVEGRSFGFLALGMSPAEIRSRLGIPISSASNRADAVEYDWSDTDGRWLVSFDASTKRAVSIGYGIYRTSPDEDRQRIEKLLFETSKGARYGHSAETIKALYGEPARRRQEVEGLNAFLGYPLSFFYPEAGVEFEFYCIIVVSHSAKDCKDQFYELSSITIHSKGHGPDWARNPASQR